MGCQHTHMPAGTDKAAVCQPHTPPPLANEPIKVQHDLTTAFTFLETQAPPGQPAAQTKCLCVASGRRGRPVRAGPQSFCTTQAPPTYQKVGICIAVQFCTSISNAYKNPWR